MRLLELTCSDDRFHDIIFNRGFNLVIGTKISKNKHKSINGIGKSMTLRLIQFMLGAKFNLRGEKKKFLENYGTFTLIFEHNNTEYCVEKKFSDNFFKLNGIKYSATKYNDKLTEIFALSSSPCSFRQIFNCFARRYDENTDYYKALKQQGQSLSDYKQKLTNLFLLGFDTNFIQEYYKLQQEIKELKNIKKAIAKQQDNQSSQKNNIDEEILVLEEKISRTEIYAGYNELKERADKLTLELNQIRNNLSKIQAQINLKKRNLKDAQLKIDIDEIKQLYQEAQLFFDNNIFQTLYDVQYFHKTLVENRKNRIHEDLKSLEKDLHKFAKQGEEIGKERDYILQNLKKSGALEERDSLMNEINNLKMEKQKIMRYALLSSEIADKENAKRERTEAIKEQSLFYLYNTLQSHIEQLELNFISLIDFFYNSKKASLEILPTKKAQCLFDIQINIEQEGSQGKEGVKTFCYDILLYKQNPVLLNFMAHDGCIFSGMDSRQQARILQVALELVRKHGLQYLLNMDFTTLDGIKSTNILSAEEIKLIEQNIVLNLNDEDPKSWLFGENF